MNWEGGTPQYFVDGKTIRVGTLRNFERKYIRKPFRHLPHTYWNITYTFKTYPDTFHTL